MKRLAWLALSVVTMLTAVASFWALSQNPFAVPLMERSAAAARAALTRAMAQTVDQAWLETRISAALAIGDSDGLELYLDLANDQNRALAPDLLGAAADYVASENAFLTRASDCAICAVDIASCKRLSQIASCAVPVEMTPIGDLNALRRAGADWFGGYDVDRLEVGLALAGLGATGLAVGSGGTSLSVKAGASLLRLARRLDAMTPRFTDTLLDMADVAVDWDKVPAYLLGQVPLDEVADTAKLAAIATLAADLDRVRTNTSTAEVLTMLRHVDNAADARTLARVASVQGPRTRHTLAVLGKSRTFRLMHRLSDIALLAVGLVTALALQLMSLGGAVLRRIVRPARR